MKFVTITRFIERVLAINPLLRLITLNYYRPIVKREIELSKCNNNDKILCIGGGFLPATAILFAKLSKCSVTVIDNDLNTVNFSKKIINKLKVNVEVVHIDGIDLNTSDYSLIHIALQIDPKEEVFNNVKITKKNNSNILMRMPKKHLKNGYDIINIDNYNDSIKQPFYSNIGRTMLYE